MLDRQRLEELSWVKQRPRGDAAAAAAARAAADMTTSPLSNVSDAIEARRRDVPVETSSHETRQVSSPAFSDEAQVGHSVVTPVRDVFRSLTPPQVSPLGDSNEASEGSYAGNPDDVREALEARLSASLDENSLSLSTSTGNSADA